MVRPVHFTYRIERDTRRPVAVAASAYRMPLDTPADYARAALAETAGDLYDAGDALGGERRVLLDHVQYFAFLAEITARIRDAVHPEARVFIEVCAPYFGALPAELLAPHVLLGVHLYDEALRDAARVIGDRILRDAEFAGDNRVLRDLARAARRRLRRAIARRMAGVCDPPRPAPGRPRAAATTLTDSAHHSAARPGRP